MKMLTFLKRKERKFLKQLKIKTMIKFIKNEIEDFKYMIFLKKVSGDTSVELYSDMKIMIHDLGKNDDYISELFIQKIADEYNTEVFVVERLIEKAKKYNRKEL